MNSSETAPQTQRQKQATARREQLLEVALDQFAEKGVAGSTTREIAQAAGITEGLIYHYFPSKMALLQAVVERYSLDREVVAIIPSVAGLPVREALMEIARQFYRVLQRSRKFVTMVFTDAHRDPELAEALESVSMRGFDVAVEFMNERIACGELKPHDPQVSVRVLHHAIVWYFLSQATCEAKLPPMAPETFLHGLVEVVLNGVAAEPDDANLSSR